MPTITNPLAYLAVTTLMALVACGLAHGVPFYRRLTSRAAEAQRFASIDGLRGFLAVGVFLHHAMFNYVYFRQGVWDMPETVNLLLGKGAVYVFFMITGFLFWSKALASGGQVEPRRLYVNRLRRLYPMYLFFLAAVLLVVAWETHFTLLDPWYAVAGQVGRWLTCGLFNFPDINGTDRIFPNVGYTATGAGISWTLRYEWWFYLLLPFLAGWPIHLARLERFCAVVIGFLIFYACRHDPRNLAHIANFLFGMTTAYVVRRWPAFPPARRWWFGLVPAACFAAIVLAYPYLDVPGSLAVRLLLAAAFLCMVYGNTFFGLLTTRWALLLGDISYSIYLLHGIILFIAVGALNRYRPISTMEPLEYWQWMGAVGILVVLIASLTYRFFEHPFIRSSQKRVAQAADKSAGLSSY